MDGDEEDLEKYELDEAIAQYEMNDVIEKASYVTYVNTKIKRDQRAEIMSCSDEQTSLRNLLLRVGQSVVFALKERKSEWAVTSKRLKSSDQDSSKSTYVDWKEAVLKSQSIAEFRSLVLDLENAIHQTQESPDRPKFTEWRKCIMIRSFLPFLLTCIIHSLTHSLTTKQRKQQEWKAMR